MNIQNVLIIHKLMKYAVWVEHVFFIYQKNKDFWIFLELMRRSILKREV